MERAFTFMRELDGPVHRKVPSSFSSKPRSEEVAIDSSWAIHVDPDAPPEVATAAEDIADFLEVGFGLKLGRHASHGNHTIKIGAGENTSTPPCAYDEGFTLKVKEDGILVWGNGPRGAIHGAIALERLMLRRGAAFAPIGLIRKSPRFAPRILRSYSSPYYFETIDGKNHYSDNYLARLAHLGYDAIWLRGELRSLSNTDVFPELGEESSRNLAVLNDLISRAGRWGIGVYLYLCEPLGLPVDHPFWKKHLNVRGPEGGEMGRPIKLYAFCTSTPEVKRFLYEASRDMFTRAPGLEGVLLITASEHTAHCKQRKTMPPCARCANRPASEIAAEVITLIYKGARDAGSRARIVAWNWAWDSQFGPEAEEEIVRALPPDVIWMANVENGGQIERFGHKNVIHEYSLSYPGPSPLYLRKARVARAAGHPVWGKIQINVTHELCSMPYMPVPFLLREKFAGLARAGVEGLMCCWIFGGYPGVGSQQANAMMWEPFGDYHKALLECAAGIYGHKVAPTVVKAWKLFSRGYANYPFDHGLYSHVLNDSPAHPFYFRPIRRIERPNWTRKIYPFGDILNWCVTFSPEVFARCYEAILKDWEKGLALLRRVMRSVPPWLHHEAERDLRVCEAIGIHFRSGLNYIRFIRLRDRLPNLGGPCKWPHDLEKRLALPLAETKREICSILREIKQIVESERELVMRYLPMVESDSRLAYHSEGGYRLRPRHLRAKLAQLMHLLEIQIPRYERRVANVLTK